MISGKHFTILLMNDDRLFSAQVGAILRQGFDPASFTFIHATSLEQAKELSCELTDKRSILILDSMVPRTISDDRAAQALFEERDLIVASMDTRSNNSQHRASLHELDKKFFALLCLDGAKQLLTHLGDSWRGLGVILFTALHLELDQFSGTPNLIYLQQPASPEMLIETVLSFVKR